MIFERSLIKNYLTLFTNKLRTTAGVMQFLDILTIFLEKLSIIAIIFSIFSTGIDAMEESTEIDITERVERHLLLPKHSVVQNSPNSSDAESSLFLMASKNTIGIMEISTVSSPENTATFDVNLRIPPSNDQAVKSQCIGLFQNWIPIATTKFIPMSAFIYSRWTLSQISSREMAIGALIVPFENILMAAPMGLLGAVEDLVSEERRKHETALTSQDRITAQVHAQNMGTILRNAHLIGLLTSVPVIIGTRLIKPIMLSCGYNPDLYGAIDDYFRIFVLGVPFQQFCSASEHFFLAGGHLKNAIAMSCMSLLSCGLNYLFVAGPLKLENVFEGIALASVVGTGINFGGYLAVYGFHKAFKNYHIFRPSVDPAFLMTIFKRGAPLALKRFLEPIAPLIYTQLILPDKPEMLAAAALMSQIFLPSVIITSSIGEAANISIKRSMDKMVTVSAFKYGIAAMVQSQIIEGLFVGSVYFFPEFFASLFVDKDNPQNQHMLENYRTALRFQLLNQFISTLGNTTAWALRGIRELKRATYSEVLTTWCIGLPLSYILVRSFDYGIEGAFIGILAGSICNTLYLQYVWWSKASAERAFSSVRTSVFAIPVFSPVPQTLDFPDSIE